MHRNQESADLPQRTHHAAAEEVQGFSPEEVSAADSESSYGQGIKEIPHDWPRTTRAYSWTGAADTAPEDGILDLDRKRRSDALTDDQVETVRSFFRRDDSSRMMPGKRDTVTRRKLKKQKRLLSDIMKTLHAKFRYEHADINICYSTFCTLRPFWVVAPTLADRDTCQCKRHSNIKLMADKLHREGIIPSASQSEQYNQLVCDKESKTCMYGTCGNCKDNRLPPISHEADCREVTYSQWVTKEKEFTKRSEGEQETRKAKVTVKESREITIGELYLKFETDLKPRFTTHTFNIGHQYRTLRSLKEQMSADEVAVHVDFSENYTCRYGAEIQSVHFGGSHRQASLHTGVYYTTKERSRSAPYRTARGTILLEYGRTCNRYFVTSERPTPTSQQSTS